MEHLDRPDWRLWLKKHKFVVVFCGTYYECRDRALADTAQFRIERVRA